MLKGEICYLVPFEESHLVDKAYLEWLRDYEVVKTINRLDYVIPVRFEEVRGYYENLKKSKNDIFFAIHFNKNNKFIGTLRVSSINWYTRVADLGILIGDKNYWGKGVATDSLRTVSKYLFEVLGMRKLTCGIMEVNPAMQKAFEKIGFKLEGRFRKADSFEGSYVDHIFMGCFQEEFKSDFSREPARRPNQHSMNQKRK